MASTVTNIVFFGSSAYSNIILEKLLTLKNFRILCVITKEDKPTGRHLAVVSNPVAKFAKQKKLNLIQTSNFDSEFIDRFEKFHSDLALVVAYGPPYFTQNMIDIPPCKIVNIHPSPLPKYRGATPGPWQIINGETQSAVTFFQIDALPDHGPIIKQIPFSISKSETSASFYDKAFKVASDNLESTLTAYVSNPKNLYIQDHSQKSYFPKLNKDSAKIDWSWNDEKIERFIRALNPWPIAWTFVQNKSSHKLNKMQIFSSAIKNNVLSLLQVQIEGKQKTDWSEIEKYYELIK